MKTPAEGYEDFSCEIVVIGGGGSGLAAAVAAAEKGKRVLVAEKRRNLGGDTAMAGGFFAAESPALKRLRNESSKAELIKKALSYAHWKTDPMIVRAFINKSGDTAEWLVNMGIKFADISQFIPTQGPRIFHLPRGLGIGVVKVLAKRCQDLGVQILRGVAIKKILIDDDGETIGVMAVSNDKDFRIHAKSVIVAAGGYAGNKQLLRQHYPYYTETLHAVGLPLTGDGLIMATEAGAATEGLGTLLLRGPYFRGALDVVTVAMEPNTIWVNKRGERFVDETSGFTWPEAANALNRQPEKVSFTLFDEEIKRGFIERGLIKGYANKPPLTKLTKLEKKLEIEAAKGGIKISYSLEQIARWIGAIPKVLINTVSEYNLSCERGYDDLLLKDGSFLVPLRKPPYYAIKCHQGFLGTIGGIKINHHMEVLNQEGDSIPGLFAAGAGTGGWESDTYCLELSGSAFGFALNSGRIAGENAADYVS
ncbi:MAG TPA: FAD-dependent oxidoreductase [Syntrophorhabdaceae bacterium]|nr:FAD-dependent oxidoreductase [Syntrophorhabdaceae bacterium]